MVEAEEGADDQLPEIRWDSWSAKRLHLFQQNQRAEFVPITTVDTGQRLLSIRPPSKMAPDHSASTISLANQNEMSLTRGIDLPNAERLLQHHVSRDRDACLLAVGWPESLEVARSLLL